MVETKKTIIEIGKGVLCTNLPESAIRKIEKDLTFDNPEYKEALKQGRWVSADLQPYIQLFEMEGNELWFTRGYVFYLSRWLKKNEYDFKIKDRTLLLKPLKLKFTGKLRPYQEDAVKDMLSYPVGVLEAATGAGKTATAIYLIMKRKQPTLIIVHSKELLYQWQDQIKKFLNVDCGLIGDGKFNIKPITVGIINTVNKRIEDLEKHFGQIVIDEAHKAGATTYMETLQEFPAKYYCGLSATPWRLDGLGDTIFASIGPKKHKVDKEMLQEIGAILIPNIHRIETDFSYMFTNDYSTMIKTLTEDFNRNSLICNTILSDFKKHNEPIMIVSDRKKHCETLQKMLQNTYGIDNMVLTGNVKGSERKEIVAGVRSGEYKVLLATISLVGEGLDIPDLSALFLTTPVKSALRLVQSVGRILRPSKGKTPRIYDFRDNDVNVLRYSGFARDRAYRSENIG